MIIRYDKFIFFDIIIICVQFRLRYMIEYFNFNINIIINYLVSININVVFINSFQKSNNFF